MSVDASDIPDHDRPAEESQTVNVGRDKRDRPKKRIRRWIIALLGVVLLVPAALPRVASSDWGRDLLLNRLNRRLAGQLHVQQVSLAWFGPCVLRNVRLQDDLERDVLRAETITVNQGLLSSVLKGGNVSEINIESLWAQLFINSEHDISLLQSVKSPTSDKSDPSALRANESLPLTDKIVDRPDLAVEIDAARLQASYVGGVLQLTAIEPVYAKNAMAREAQQPARDLSIVRRLEVTASEYGFDIVVEAEGAIGSVVELLADPGVSDPRRAQGRFKIAASGSWSPAGYAGKLTADLTQVRFAEEEVVSSKPIDLRIEVGFESDDRFTDAEIVLSGEAGEVAASLHYASADRPIELTIENVLNAIVMGSDLSVPECMVEVRGDLDLAAIAQAVPALLHLREDRRVVGGRLKIADFVLHTDPHSVDLEAELDMLCLRGSIKLHDLALDTARQGARQRIELPAAELRFDVALQRGSGAVFQEALFKSDFAHISIAGTASDLKANFDADLAGLYDRLQQVFELGDLRMSGEINGTLSAVHVSSEKLGSFSLRTKLSVSARDLQIGSADRSGLAVSAVEWSEVQLDFAGHAEISDGEIRRLNAQEFELNLNDDILTRATGWYDTLNHTFGVNINSDKVMIAALARLAAAIGVEDVLLDGGRAAIEASAKRADRDAPIVLSGHVRVTDPTRKGQLLCREELEATLKSAEWTISDDRADRLTVERIEARAGTEFSTVISGWYDFDEKTFEAAVEIPEAEMEFISRQAQAWGISALDGYAGSLALSATLERREASGALTSSGSASTKNLRRGGRPLVSEEVSCRWEDVQFMPQTSLASATAVDVDGDFGSFSVRNARVSVGDSIDFSGQASGHADISQSLEILGRVMDWAKVPNLSGQMSFQNSCSSSAGRMVVSGSAEILNLAVGQGPSKIEEPRVVFNYETELDPQRGHVKIVMLEANSPEISADLTGTVADYHEKCVVSLRGNYAGEWRDITEKLRLLVPSIPSEIVLAGPSEGQFIIHGSICGQSDLSIAQRLEGEIGVGWTSAEVFGLPIGPAELLPKLHDGRLTIPPTRVAASGGHATLGAVIDLTPPGPALLIPSKVVVLDKVDISAALAESLLSRFNPIFLDLASVEGKVSLETRDVVLPLAEGIKRGGSGGGRLDLAQMKVQPAGLLAELLRLSGLNDSEVQSVRVGGVDFEIKEGRLHYNDFEMVFAERFDLRFYGSVGFDDTLDLVVSIPLSSVVLDQLRLDQKTLSIVGLLSDARVDIPIVGTRLKPKLDLSAIDLTKLLLPGKGLLPTLGEIFGGDKTKRDDGKRKSDKKSSGSKDGRRKPVKRRGVKRRPRSSDE